MVLRNAAGLTEQEYLEQYKPGNYEKPSVTVDMLIFTLDKETPEYQLNMLLVKRKDHPYMGSWAIPGGFVEMEESMDQAAHRELKEETGLEHIYMEQLYTWGEVKRDPRMRVISTSYLALLPKENLLPVAGDDAEDVGWFTVKRTELGNTSNSNSYGLILENKEKQLLIEYQAKEEYRKNSGIWIKDTKIKPLPLTEHLLAFDHIQIINMALERLKNKIEYTPIGFTLLPKEFTMMELQKVYETILGKTLYKANFRKKMLSQLEPTQRVKTGSHRPGQYYRYKSTIERETIV